MEELSSEVHVAAQELGRRGGLRGGPARARALSPTRRSEIARAAARTRWANKKRFAQLTCQGCKKRLTLTHQQVDRGETLTCGGCGWQTHLAWKKPDAQVD